MNSVSNLISEYGKVLLAAFCAIAVLFAIGNVQYEDGTSGLYGTFKQILSVTYDDVQAAGTSQSTESEGVYNKAVVLPELSTKTINPEESYSIYDIVVLSTNDTRVNAVKNAGYTLMVKSIKDYKGTDITESAMINDETVYFEEPGIYTIRTFYLAGSEREESNLRIAVRTPSFVDEEVGK